jgi:hypothetical protein
MRPPAWCRSRPLQRDPGRAGPRASRPRPPGGVLWRRARWTNVGVFFPGPSWPMILRNLPLRRRVRGFRQRPRVPAPPTWPRPSGAGEESQASDAQMAEVRRPVPTARPCTRPARPGVGGHARCDEDPRRQVVLTREQHDGGEDQRAAGELHECDLLVEHAASATTAGLRWTASTLASA